MADDRHSSVATQGSSVATQGSSVATQGFPGWYTIGIVTYADCGLYFQIRLRFTFNLVLPIGVFVTLFV